MNFNGNRRQFFQFAAGLSLAGLLDRSSWSSLVTAMTSPLLEITVFNPDGANVTPKALNQAYFLALDGETLPQPRRSIKDGKLLTAIPASPFAVALKLPVTDFGAVTLYADNGGKGYTGKDFPLNLNGTFAETRLRRVRDFIGQEKGRGIKFSPALESRLETAWDYRKRGLAATDSGERVKWFDRSLSESMWVGELAVVAKAQQLIEKQPSRPHFLFGANFFGYPQQGEEYIRRFQELFNFATIPFYWKNFEPILGKPDYSLTDSMVKELQRLNITPKGHPLVWFHGAGIPDEIRGKSFQEIKGLVARRVEEITRHYRGEVNYYDIINEPHGIAWSNELNFTLGQFVELTRIASESSRRGNEKTFRIINNCCLWAENISYHQPPQHSPHEYLKAVIDAGIEFEAIGLQLYYPDQDLFEIDRLLERFSRLGKPLHITELGVSSATSVDEVSYFKDPPGLWRARWSEAVQADWIEAFYTIAYSKSYIQAISWWDLSDNGNFWPHGGLSRKDLTPKLGYERLKTLITEWRKR
ncbi:MAG: hypothetical protein N5P05_001531 [Chroococcopsis gigantea SAG 12.99]|jgi:endo-1,4-beta-xylanase|nr:endo-1,4-beta-xylanase [Chlorogloea purpurea SAG 13.99]MDV2999925.1 hypothetical protein [Chroococcopsis gigantea SAG 12.99]